MAYLRLSNVTPPTTSTITLAVDGLDYPANQYYAINLYSSSGTLIGAMNYGSGGSGGSYYTNAYTVSGLSAGTQYGFYVNYKYSVSHSATRVPSSGYFYASTESPPPPSTPSLGTPSINGKDITIPIYISSNTTEIQLDRSWISGYPDGYLYPYNQTTYNYSFTVPDYNTQYYLDVKASNSYGASGWSGLKYFTSGAPPAPPPSGVGTINFVSNTVSSVTISWSYASGADYYAVEYRPAGTSTWLSSNFSVTGNSHTITGLSNNTSYDFKVYARNGGGNGPPSHLYGVSTSDGRPSAPSNFRITTTNKNGFDVAWNSVTDATGYSVEVYHVGTGSMVYSQYNMSSTSHSITGLNEYVTYDIKLYAVNSYGNSPATWLYDQKTKDETPPVISVTGDGNGRVYASWSASDSHSGLHSTQPFQVYIGTPGGTASSLVSQGYTTNYYKSFTTDANGNEFVHNSIYPVRIRAYDNSLNTSYQDINITYKVARPSDWSWHTTKSAGQIVEDNITSAEWTSFCTKINQFRQYKSLSNYPFTSVVKGSLFTEAIFNEARTAISQMSPPTAVNPLYKENNVWILRAVDLNNLRDALNSIQ